MQVSVLLFISDCGNYAVLEQSFVSLYYDLKRVNLVASEIGYDSFDLLNSSKRYDVIYEGKEFYNLKPSKIELL